MDVVLGRGLDLVWTESLQEVCDSGASDMGMVNKWVWLKWLKTTDDR